MIYLTLFELNWTLEKNLTSEVEYIGLIWIWINLDSILLDIIEMFALQSTLRWCFFWWTELHKSLKQCARTQPSPSSTLRPAPCSSRTAAPGHWRCPRPHWCSSWPWWQQSVGSPGTTSTPHPRWCKRAARRGKSSHWEQLPPNAYWKKANQTVFIDSLLLLASLFALLLISLNVFISVINFTRIQRLACNL